MRMTFRQPHDTEVSKKLPSVQAVLKNWIRLFKFAEKYYYSSCSQHNEELNDLYSSPNIVRVIKSRRMRWAGYVAHMGEERGVYRVLVGKPEGGDHWGDLGIDGWIILGWISRRWDVGM
jgi:hypothetical protein